ncbi:MAG: hypothetical protein A3E78_11780 [Alphaproteobacteria bacterium RIFCSPHIGHO2_12_FULL_63_12]|nr:MAG: hypothetical protein A3E78_11780 [Alphaproteobacteria bacterium RIFCSPHIGHO2_12_FULL_63_12]
MGAFEAVDLLRREFGERWLFQPFFIRRHGKTQIDYVVARPKQKASKRTLRFSSPAELAERIRELEKETP